MNDMPTRYRLTRRGTRGGTFYCVDKATGKRSSLRTNDRDEARQIVEARNQAERQPVLNLQIAKAYLAGADKGMTTRTWQNALDALIQTKLSANQARWRTAAKDKALAPLLSRVIIDTPAELLLQALQTGTVSTIRLGRAREAGRLPRAVRAGGTGPQQQSRASQCNG